MHAKRPRRVSAAWAAAALLAASCAQLQDLPRLKPSDLKFKLPQTSAIYDSQGQLITTLHREQNRTNVPLKEMPVDLRHAVIAIEDERFYEHDGVDLKAVVRALIKNATSGEIQEGGSTITQQYVKNVIIAPGETAEKTLERKITEAALSRQLEKKLSKDEILERYLNTVYFGQGAYGVEAAARAYFNKHARRLTLGEGATLAGLIRAPEIYDPIKHPEGSKTRRDLVLSNMADLGYISIAEKDEVTAKKLKLDPAETRARYAAPYFVDYVQRLITFDPRFDEVGKTVEERVNRLFAGGLKIYTTVDLEMQAAAEEAVDGVLYEDTDPHGSIVALEPETGYVRAMVGGRDWFSTRKKDRYSKLNLAIQAEPDLQRVKVRGKKDKFEIAPAPGTGRQAGSAFKPFALAAALENGISLSKIYKAPGSMVIPIPGSAPWDVQNYEGGAFGAMSLLQATINSVNVVYAQVILEIGPQIVVDLARDMGIRTPLLATPSAVLGSNEVNPLGMASAYGTLANGGLRVDPVAITKIVDTTKNPDKVIYQDRTKPERVLPESTAYLTTSALIQVIQNGTGYAAAGVGRPAAGKTGTAQEYRDAWFVGYTPDLVAAVWVGYPEAQLEMKTSCYTTLCRITRRQVTGGSWPTEIWTAFMVRALANVPATPFNVPELGSITVTIDTRTTCLADETTPEEFVEERDFPLGSEPTQVCRNEDAEEKVPNLFGFPWEEAAAILANKGFQVVRQDEPSDTYPPGRVIGQSPEAGTKLLPGDTVTLMVSVAATEQSAYVPNVLGFTRGDAENELSNDGFAVRVIIEGESNDDQARDRSGLVWKQSPPGGEELEPGGTVTIWVNP